MTRHSPTDLALIELLKLRTEALQRVSNECNALRIALGQSIGSGVNIEEYEVCLMHKPCARVINSFPHSCES